MSRPAPRPRTAYRHWTSIATRWADNDVYGHVNNTVHYQWFDTAVNGWLIEAGLLDIAHGDPIGLVVETRCRYFAPVTHPATVDAGLAVASLGRSAVTYAIGLFMAGHDAPLAEGEFVHVYVERAGRRPAPLPDAWREALGRLA